MRCKFFKVYLRICFPRIEEDFSIAQYLTYKVVITSFLSNITTSNFYAISCDQTSVLSYLSISTLSIIKLNPILSLGQFKYLLIFVLIKNIEKYRNCFYTYECIVYTIFPLKVPKSLRTTKKARTKLNFITMLIQLSV